MKTTRAILRFLFFAAILTAPCCVFSQTTFVGDWALHPRGNRAAWLGVSSNESGMHAEIMWISGSVNPVESARIAEGKLILQRPFEVNGPVINGETSKVKNVEIITAELDGQKLKGVRRIARADSSEEPPVSFTGERLPPMPPAPDLSKVRLGSKIELFNGKNLKGWEPVETDAFNGWCVRDGLLCNMAAEKEGTATKKFANLRTIAEFKDFSLHVEVRVFKEENSGVYLRGIYEVQVYDTYGKPVDSHNMGAIYSRLTPMVSAEKPAGEWQTMDITMVNRHVTVILNGKTIIENQPLRGPTGGALWSEVDRQGPILLQGDHTSIEYRKLTLRPATLMK